MKWKQLNKKEDYIKIFKMKMNKMKTKWNQKQIEQNKNWKNKTKITKENKQKIKVKKNIICQLSASAYKYITSYRVT